jgi:hypothetical protein
MGRSGKASSRIREEALTRPFGGQAGLAPKAEAGQTDLAFPSPSGLVWGLPHRGHTDTSRTLVKYRLQDKSLQA